MPNDAKPTKRPLALVEDAARRDAPNADPAGINGVPRDQIDATLRHRIAYAALSHVGRDLEREVAMVAWATLQLAERVAELREALAPQAHKP